jgi:type I restriction enzyme, S subunit
MSKIWPRRRLGDLCHLVNGRAFKPSDWRTEGLPIVRIQNLNDHRKPFNRFGGAVSPNHLIDDGAILLSWSGTPGTSFGCFRWTRGEAVVNQHIFSVHVDENQIDGEFFISAVNSRLEEMISKAHGGVGLRHITKGKLEAIELPLPPLPEQRRIVARIKECMARIEEIERLRAAALEESDYLAPSLYEAIECNHDWPSMKVVQLIKASRNGRSIRRDNQNSTGHVLSLSAVRGITLDFESTKPIALPETVAAQYAIRGGDVFVSRSNTRELVGLASVAEVSLDRVIYPDLLIKLEIRPEVIRSRFLAYSLRTSTSRRQIRQRAVGSSQSMVKISGERLREVAIPVPSLAIQDAVLEELDRCYRLSSEILTAIKSADYAHLRDAILRKAFAGEL